tara:strand:- start:2118 stop:2576 length:459 start_codon:yes stop_codon:yes gene_type:complete
MFSILLAALSPHIRKHEAAREKGFPKRKDRVTELAAESSIPILVHAPSSPVPAGVTETHHLTSTVDVVLQLVLFAVEHAARVRKEGECNCSKTEEEKNPTKTCPLIFDWKWYDLKFSVSLVTRLICSANSHYHGCQPQFLPTVASSEQSSNT